VGDVIEKKKPVGEPAQQINPQIEAARSKNFFRREIHDVKREKSSQQYLCSQRSKSSCAA
jgi:hypothetical protein